MNKELQDKGWNALPEEFKEEVKASYKLSANSDDLELIGITLADLFGHDNLTSVNENQKSCDTPKFHVGQKVLVDGIECPDTPLKIISYEGNKKYLVGNIVSIPALIEEDSITEYIEPKSDNIEEKELNLCEILKGHEEEEFYSPIYGNVKISIEESKIKMRGKYNYMHLSFNGCNYNHKDYCDFLPCLIFPSYDLYLKYPLDTKKAWDEWQEGQKPKTPKKG